MSILSGVLCLKNNCYKCCLETEMIISLRDITRILEAGYKLSEFLYFDGKNWRLRNVNGRCFFLNTDGTCKIYSIRPLGCRAYPVILVESNKEVKCGVDDYCPFSQEITDRELVDGCKKLVKLFRELGEKV